ncbi:hypothetical protein [Ornithinimicrobium sp. W1665]|uniref:hypothetical protein n=1 Tax=Ornithinimicrobium sp. W1665 TaxID=3416666 RepID=UPI003CEE28E0
MWVLRVDDARGIEAQRVDEARVIEEARGIGQVLRLRDGSRHARGRLLPGPRRRRSRPHVIPRLSGG